jgi:hypothetical protein
MSGVTNAVFGQLRKTVSDTSYAEQVTRKRVDRLETWAEAFTSMGFWMRLRWLLLGK